MRSTVETMERSASGVSAGNLVVLKKSGERKNELVSV